MKTIHFIYAVPDSTNPFLYRFDKYARKTGLYSPSYRNGKSALISWPKPVLAPFSITYNLLNALKKKYKVRLYSHKEIITCRINPDDILLFYPPPNAKDRTQPDYSKVGYKTCLKYKDNQAFIITAYNNDFNQVGYYQVLLKERNLKYIAICGKIWIDKWHESPLRAFLNMKNLLNVNMSIDISQYPKVKESFNPKGKRRFLYIGNTKVWKNTKQLEEIAKMYKNFDGGYISDGEILGWKKISGWRDLNIEFVQEIAKNYDIFINCSYADAQATTILEQMSFGFPIACTAESGYVGSSIVQLNTVDTKYNCRKLMEMQMMEEDKLVEMCEMNRKIVEKYHNWNNFTDQIVSFIER